VREYGRSEGYLSHETAFDFGVNGEVFEDMWFVSIFLGKLVVDSNTFLCGHLDCLSHLSIAGLALPGNAHPYIYSAPETPHCSKAYILGNESRVGGGDAEVPPWRKNPSHLQPLPNHRQSNSIGPPFVEHISRDS